MERSNRPYLREVEYSEQPKRRTGAIIALVVLGIGIIILLIYTFIIKKSTYNSWELKNTYEAIPDSNCIRSSDGFVLYNRDGAQGYDVGGSVLWKISYDFNCPIASVSAKSAAFADLGANTVHVTDGTGTNNVINVSEKIVDISTSDQGVVAIRTDGVSTDHIYVYDIQGKMLLEIKTDVRKSGFPVAMAMSPDGTKLVTSYLKALDKQESWVTFYNFGDVGQSYSDKIVGSYAFEDDMIPEVRFLTNDRVLLAGEDKFLLYKFREVPEELLKHNSESGLTMVSSFGEMFAVAEKSGEGISHITLYDLNGKNLSSVDTGMGYERICLGKDEMILSVGESCVIYRKDGTEKFCSKLNGAIRYMYPINNESTYIIIGENSLSEIQLTTKNVENQGVEASEQ